MPRRPPRKLTNDWRDNVIRNIPDEYAYIRAITFTTAYRLISTAAYNRRMTISEFVGRAALAVAVFDSDGEDTWDDVTDKEPPLRDRRRMKLESRRLRGRGFGPWKITGMNE